MCLSHINAILFVSISSPDHPRYVCHVNGMYSVWCLSAMNYLASGMVKAVCLRNKNSFVRALGLQNSLVITFYYVIKGAEVHLYESVCHPRCRLALISDRVSYVIFSGQGCFSALISTSP